mgnify:CR=1 FL=1
MRTNVWKRKSYVYYLNELNQLERYDKKTGHTFAKILNVLADENILTQGKVDIKKLDPIFYDGDTYGYYTVGKRVADAYSVYKKVK